MGNEADDRALLAACAAGDAAAWDAIVQRYGRLIWSVALRLGLDEPEAADVFQEVCLTLFEKAGALRPDTRLSAWLVVVTANKARDRQRAARRTAVRVSAAGLPTGEEDERVEPTDPDALPEEEVLRLEERQAVRLALERLPERCRTLLERLFAGAEPKSYAELARELGMPQGSLGPIRGRCLAALKKQLAALGFW